MLQQNIRLSGATVVVTGVAGFIGASLTRRLPDEYPDCRVIGIDNITDYYDVRLKHGRLERLRAYGDRYEVAVNGAVGGAAGVTHAASTLHTDCEPNRNVLTG